MKALDFALDHNVHSMKLGSILDNVEQARAAGDDMLKRNQESSSSEK